jgi:hypothetical protein
MIEDWCDGKYNWTDVAGLISPTVFAAFSE